MLILQLAVLNCVLFPLSTPLSLCTHNLKICVNSEKSVKNSDLSLSTLLDYIKKKKKKNHFFKIFIFLFIFLSFPC